MATLVEPTQDEALVYEIGKQVAESSAYRPGSDNQTRVWLGAQAGARLALQSSKAENEALQARVAELEAGLDRAIEAADDILAPLCAGVGKCLYDTPGEDAVATMHSYEVVIPFSAFKRLYDATDKDRLDAIHMGGKEYVGSVRAEASKAFDLILATLSPASHVKRVKAAPIRLESAYPASHDSRLADELERLAGMAPSGPWKNGLWAGSEPQKHVVDMGEPPKAPFLLAQERSAYTTPYGVVHSDGPPGEVEAATALIIALHRNLPTILAALRSTPAPDALRGEWVEYAERRIHSWRNNHPDKRPKEIRCMDALLTALRNMEKP